MRPKMKNGMLPTGSPLCRTRKGGACFASCCSPVLSPFWDGLSGYTGRFTFTPRMTRRVPPTRSPSLAQRNTMAVPRRCSAPVWIMLLSLYREHLAPLVITLGGGGGPRDSEGGVGHDYLLAHGVPENQIIAETQSTNTEESAARLAAIARENHLNRILAVSDGTHLFRIHALCTSMGLTVSTSPRTEARPLGFWDAAMRLMHEMISYTLWRLKVH